MKNRKDIEKLTGEIVKKGGIEYPSDELAHNVMKKISFVKYKNLREPLIGPKLQITVFAVIAVIILGVIALPMTLFLTGGYNLTTRYQIDIAGFGAAIADFTISYSPILLGVVFLSMFFFFFDRFLNIMSRNR